VNPLDHLPEIHPDPMVATIAVLSSIATVALAYYTYRGGKKAILFLHGKVSLAVALGFAAALGFTLFSADSSWRFAGKMGMTDRWERGILFGVAELGVLALVFMARQNLNGPEHTPGFPGTLVKVVVSVQIVPAFEVSNGFWIGVVRAFFGPIMAMFMWHLMLGIELKHRKPEAQNNSMAAQIGRELRTRIFAYMGLAQRNRTAEEIIADRHLAQAVELYAVLAIMEEDDKQGFFKKRTISRLHRRASRHASRGCGGDPKRRQILTNRLAERRQARNLSKMDLPEVWNTAEILAPEAHALSRQTRHQIRDGLVRAVQPVQPLFPLPPRTVPQRAAKLPPVEPSREEMAAYCKKNNQPASPSPQRHLAFQTIDAGLDDPRKEGREEFPRTGAADEHQDQGAPDAGKSEGPDTDPDPDPPARQQVPEPEEPALPHPEDGPLPAPRQEQQNAQTVSADVKVPEPEKDAAAEHQPSQVGKSEGDQAHGGASGGDDGDSHDDDGGGDGSHNDDKKKEWEGGGVLGPREKARKDQSDAREAYGRSVAEGKPLEPRALAQQFGNGLRWGQMRIQEWNEQQEQNKHRGSKRFRIVVDN